MKSPKITVVIPTYHRPDLLMRAIRSVQMQEFEDFECIIFSDHCPKARLVYENFFKNDGRMIFIENPNEWKKNVGAIGVNYALKNSRSNIITYLTDDNMFLPNHLKVVYEGISSGHSLVQTNAYHMHMGSGDNKIRDILERGNDIDLFYKQNVNDNLNIRNVTTCPNDMIRLGHSIRELVDSVGYWTPWHEGDPNSGFNEDGDFISRLAASTFNNHDIGVYTGIYYARGSCCIRDNVYHEQVSSLSEDEIFVYPDLVYGEASL
jgi:glycosyltransferase involved in cell wall biosynthesis